MQIAQLIKENNKHAKTFYILEYICGYTKAEMIADDSLELSVPEYEQYLSILARLATNEPLAYIIGQQEFYENTFLVNQDVLIPRPDTEILVNFAIDYCTKIREKILFKPPIKILELGTGSGCIAISIDKFLRKINFNDIEIIAADVSVEALTVARQNAIILSSDVQFMLSDWFSNIDLPSSECHGFDLIISNPPYIAANDRHMLDLKHEPKIALTDNLDGLSCLSHIINYGHPFLKSEGVIALEHGFDQAQHVSKLFTAANFKNIQLLHDYGGNPRVSYGIKT
jgi:release factor glutamine methyltransferase